MKTGLSIITIILSVFISMPIGLYLQYSMLSLVSATPLMWFLFWVNLPVLILIQVLVKIVEAMNK